MNTVIFESYYVYLKGVYHIGGGRIDTFPFIGILKEISCSISIIDPYQSDYFFRYKLLINKEVYDSFIMMEESYRVGSIEIGGEMLYFAYTTESDKDYQRIVNLHKEYKEHASLLFKDKLI